MKKLISVLLSAATAAVICGCSGGGDVVSEIPDYRGNSEGNIVHGMGRVAFRDGSLYYSHGDGIFKADKNGKNKNKIADGVCSDINVVGDWVYYVARDEKMYKMRADGSEKTAIYDGICFGVHVVNDWIYFSEVTSSTPQFTEYGNYDLYVYAICKMRVDGAEKSTLAENRNSFDFTVDDNGVVYYSDVVRAGIYKIGEDGREQLVTASTSTMMIVADDGWIYYSDGIRSLNKVRDDGTQKSVVSEGAIFGVNIDGDWIYCLNASKGGVYTISGMKKDGSESVAYDTGDNSPASLSIAGDWIYYVDFKESAAYDENDPTSDVPLHKIRKDGKKHQVVK